MKRSNLFPVLIGAVIVVLIVTAATLWMSAGARKATDDAVEKSASFIWKNWQTAEARL